MPSAPKRRLVECYECVFWRVMRDEYISRSDYITGKYTQYAVGLCRRNAPQVPLYSSWDDSVRPLNDRVTVWPQTAENDTCGDGEAK